MDDPSQLYQSARERMSAGDFVAAAQLFERSVALNPHFKALELLGECRIRLGLLREAIVPLAAATALNEQSRAPSLLADVLCQLGDSDDAIRMARLALARSPTNRAALEVLRKLEHVPGQ